MSARSAHLRLVDPPPDDAAAVRTFDDGIPAAPPPEVLAEVDLAADRGRRMAEEDRELNFTTDPDTGRMVVEVRELSTGRVLGRIKPSQVLDLMTGPLGAI